MKKTWFLAAFVAATAGMMLTACSDTMDGQSISMGNTIEVRAMMGNHVGTRAVPTNAETTTASLTGFNLFAWQADVESPVIDAKYAGSNGTFNDASQDATPHYWPEGTVKFWAYALNNAVPGEGVATPVLNDAADGVTFAWDVLSDDAELQNDPVLAYNAQPKNEDDNKVNLTFQHLLSRVGVNVYAPKYNQNTVRLLGFGFESVSVKGDFAYTFAPTTTTLPYGTWTETAEGGEGNVGLTDVVLPNEEEQEEGTELWWTAGAAEGPTMPCKETDENDLDLSTKLSGTPWLNVIPGKNVANNLELVYEVEDPTTNEWTTKIAKVALGAGLIKNLEGDTDNDTYLPGYEYIYNVRILGQNTDDATVTEAEIEVDNVTVNEWIPEGLEEVKTENTGSGSNLKQILDDAPAFATVTVTQDVILDTERINITKDVNIDLGGHTLTVNHSGGNGSAFDIKSGHVTITNGTIVCTQEDSNGYEGEVDAITVRSGAELTIDGVEITVNTTTGSCLYAFDGSKIYVKGGTYTNSTTGTGPDHEQAMCLNQANVTTQLIFVSGGTFYGQNPAAGDNSGKVSTFLQDETYESVYDEENKCYTVQLKSNGAN